LFYLTTTINLQSCVLDCVVCNVQVLIHRGDGRKDEGLTNEDDRLRNKDDGVKSEDDGVRNEDDGDIVLMAAKLGKVCFLTDTEENILYVIPDEF
jgi:hypothetical protein